jgi:UDP-N-acetylglucosamine acyltransferase
MSSAPIHPTAVVSGKAEIDPSVVIGPCAVVEDNVHIDAGTTLGPHTVIREFCRIGKNNTIDAHAVIGGLPQHTAYDFLMSYAHIGHDCMVGDNVTLSNNIVLGGHVEVGDFVVLGGCAGAHQFLRIGSYAMVGGYVPLRKDVLPYSMVGGEPVRHYRLNSIGLRRGGFDKERYRAVEAAFRALRDGNNDLTGVPDTEDVDKLRVWLAGKSKYGVYGFAGA